VASIHRLDHKIDERSEWLETKISMAETSLTAKLDALTIAVSRLEGAVYHGLPEPRRATE
jgi:hypothetical protein